MSSRKSFLLDADAVVHLHSLDLIDPLVDAARTGKLALHCTRCVWEHELSALRDVREALEGAGLQVHEVAPSSPAGAFFKRLVRDRGNPGRNSRGELHLIAWAATHQSSDIALVAREAGARDLAAKHGVWALDLADFLSELVRKRAAEGVRRFQCLVGSVAPREATSGRARRVLKRTETVFFRRTR